MKKITWDQIETVLWPHATVANGRELHWIRWCWQILDHEGYTTYTSEPEHAMVLMRAVALLRIHQDYAFIMLEIDPTMDANRVFQELCAATGCHEKATLLWEHKRIMDELLDAYVEWDPMETTYDPAKRNERGWSYEELLEDLKKTLPPGSEEDHCHDFYPQAYTPALRDDEGISSLREYHQWLDSIRERHVVLWLENNFVLEEEAREYETGVRLYFHFPWERAWPFFQKHQCWGTEEELGWYREMWGLLQEAGYTGFKIYGEEVTPTLVLLVETYQIFSRLALDRPIAIKAKEEFERAVAGSESCTMDDFEEMAADFVPKLVSFLGNSSKYRSPGRFGSKKVDATTIFLRRTIASLPITDKSLIRHHSTESAWLYDAPAGSSLKLYNGALLQARMDSLRIWLTTGRLDPAWLEPHISADP